MSKNQNFRLQELVVLSSIEGATMWRVVKLESNTLGVIDAETAHEYPGRNLTTQWMDIGMFKRPTEKQMARFVAFCQSHQVAKK
jgi:hypothetical protein